MDNNCLKYHPYQSYPWKVMFRNNFFAKCKLWPWPWWYDSKWRSWYDCVIYYQDQSWLWGVMARTRILGMCALWPWPRRYYIGSRSWLALGSWTTILWKLSRSNLEVRSYGPDPDFWYVYTVTLTLEIWIWVKVNTHPWVMDNNCVKYHPDQTWQWGIMARTGILATCALWPLPWRYDLASWTTSVQNIILIQLGSDELWPEYGF